MRKNIITKFITTLFVFFVLVSASFAQAKYEELMDKADSLVKSGNFVEAFSVAQEGIKLDANQFTAYYYAAFSLYKRGLLAEAEPFAKDAVFRATVTDKQSAQKLLDTITGLKTFSEQVQIGDQAIQDGLINKAAIAYTKAFDGNPAQTDIGMKAADLWLNRLNNILETARILNLISKQSSNEETAKKAQSLLDDIKPKISAEYSSQMKKVDSLIYENKYKEATDQLITLINIYQTYFNPENRFQENKMPNEIIYGEQGLHLKMLKLYALQKRNSEAIKEFAEVIKRGNVNLLYLLNKTDYLDEISFDPNFQSFIGDAFGNDTMKMVQSLAARDFVKEKLILIKKNYIDALLYFNKQAELTLCVAKSDKCGNQLYASMWEPNYQGDILYLASITNIQDCSFSMNFFQRPKNKIVLTINVTLDQMTIRELPISGYAGLESIEQWGLGFYGNSLYPQIKFSFGAKYSFAFNEAKRICQAKKD